jgi:hypothetical protein
MGQWREWTFLDELQLKKLGAAVWRGEASGSQGGQGGESPESLRTPGVVRGPAVAYSL